MPVPWSGSVLAQQADKAMVQGAKQHVTDMERSRRDKQGTHNQQVSQAVVYTAATLPETAKQR